MSKSVLVVDDDPGVLALLLRVLEAEGYQVAVLSDFAQAKDRLRAERFDVLVADVRLGEFNGLQLVIQARLQDPTIRIVVMSGWDDIIVARDAAEYGAVSLLKPFTAEGLLDAIRSAGV